MIVFKVKPATNKKGHQIQSRIILIIVFLGVGINDNEFLDGIKLFPNPSINGKFTLVNIPSESEISIFNSEGKLIEKNEIETNKFEWLSKNNSQGIYFIKIKYKDAVKTMKWVKLN